MEQKPIFGQYGLTRLRYLGKANGRWRGPKSCHWYEFRRERREAYVDGRDVSHLLMQRDGQGKRLFGVPR